MLLMMSLRSICMVYIVLLYAHKMIQPKVYVYDELQGKDTLVGIDHLLDTYLKKHKNVLPRGPKGQDGERGPKGQDGVSPDPATVVNSVLTKLNSTETGFSTIKSIKMDVSDGGNGHITLSLPVAGDKYYLELAGSKYGQSITIADVVGATQYNESGFNGLMIITNTGGTSIDFTFADVDINLPVVHNRSYIVGGYDFVLPGGGSRVFIQFYVNGIVFMIRDIKVLPIDLNKYAKVLISKSAAPDNVVPPM